MVIGSLHCVKFALISNNITNITEKPFSPNFYTSLYRTSSLENDEEWS
jgi:hypothetical protein